MELTEFLIPVFSVFGMVTVTSICLIMLIEQLTDVIDIIIESICVIIEALSANHVYDDEN